MSRDPFDDGEVDVDAAWAEIVANWDTPASAGRSGKAAEDRAANRDGGPGAKDANTRGEDGSDAASSSSDAGDDAQTDPASDAEPADDSQDRIVDLSDRATGTSAPPATTPDRSTPTSSDHTAPDHTAPDHRPPDHRASEHRASEHRASDQTGPGARADDRADDSARPGRRIGDSGPRPRHSRSPVDEPHQTPRPPRGRHVGPRDIDPDEPSFLDGLDGVGEPDGYERPDPPPLPQPRLSTALAWLGAVGGPALLLLAAIFWRTVPAPLIAVAVLGFIAGFVTLVIRMPDRKDDDTDDGAVV